MDAVNRTIYPTRPIDTYSRFAPMYSHFAPCIVPTYHYRASNNTHRAEAHVHGVNSESDMVMRGGHVWTRRFMDGR